MHIYDFLTDEHQYNLKAKAYKHKRFEDVLMEYKKLFLKDLESCKVSSKPVFLDPTLRTNNSVMNWLECCRRNILADIDSIEKLFDEVIDGYFLFIHSKHYLAALKYQDILDRFGLAVDADIDRLGLFFRGFKKSKTRDSTDEKQYYHIPFNLRYLLGNQRFSFSGVPILYIGASVADIYFEFDEFDLNSKNMSIAAFAFNPIAHITLHAEYQLVKEKTRIFNITNEIYNIINNIFQPLISSGANLPPCDDEKYSPNHIHLVVYFKKFILSQLCTFPKQRTPSSFYEEYVIPQLLTEALLLHKYDGIIFPSTKFRNQKITISSPTHNLFYKENLAMFSSYHHTEQYDKMLLDNFVVNIIDPKKFATYNVAKGLKDISKLQLALSLKLHGKEKSRGKTRISNGLHSIRKKISVYDNLHIDGNKYLDTIAGKMELKYIQEYLNYLSEQIRYLNTV